MSIVEQSLGVARVRGRIWIGVGAVYAVAAFAPALDGGRAGQDAAWSVVPFCATFAIAFLPWGHWTDRHGAAAALRLAAIMLFLAGIVLALPLGEVGWVTGRALEGAAAAGFPPAAQAALAALGGGRRAGRAIGGMSIAVAVGTLLVPLCAGLAETEVGTDAVVVAGALGLPAIAFIAVRPFAGVRTSGDARATRTATGAQSVPLVLTAPLLAAWGCAFLVLIAYWTVVTRAAPLLGPAGAGLGEDVARAVPMVGGVLGILLTARVGRTADRVGPRVPMLVVLVIGAAGLTLAAASASAPAAAFGVGAFVAAYWCYLTLVGVQVVRSAPAEAHGRALGGLYSSMWTGAAVGGALVTLVGSWTSVLWLCAAAWLLATVAARRWFLDAADPVDRVVQVAVAGMPPRAATLSSLDAGTRTR